jgi:hypothetical protein
MSEEKRRETYWQYRGKVVEKPSGEVVNWRTFEWLICELGRWRVCWQASQLHKEYFISFAAIKRNKERKITAV